MTWSVFKDTMRYTLRMTLIWGVGFASLMILILQMSPFLEGLELVELLNSLPTWMLGAIGVTDASVMGTVEGIIALGVFGKLALLFTAYPVVMGLRVTSAEESAGIMDVMLSLPLPRWRIILEKFLAYTLNIFLLMAITIGGLYIGQFGVSVELDINKLVLVTMAVIPVMIFLLGLTTFTGSVISHHQTVIIIVTVYIMFSFAVQSVAPMVEASWMDSIETFSLFTYFNVENTLNNGISVSHVSLMLVLALACLSASFFTFERRDIAV